MRLQSALQACLVVLGSAPSCGLRFSHHRPSPRRNHLPETGGGCGDQSQLGDITVYLIAGGVPQRLGMVSSGGVRLRALPVAGRPFTSETILVLPGQAIFWTLENNLETSNFTVY